MCIYNRVIYIYGVISGAPDAGVWCHGRFGISVGVASLKRWAWVGWGGGVEEWGKRDGGRKFGRADGRILRKFSEAK